MPESTTSSVFSGWTSIQRRRNSPPSSGDLSRTTGTSLAGPPVQPNPLWDLSPPVCGATHSLTWPTSSAVGPLVCFSSAADPPSFHQHRHRNRLHPQTVTTRSVCSRKPSPSSSLDVGFVSLLTDVSRCWLAACTNACSQGSFCHVWCFLLGNLELQPSLHTSLKSTSPSLEVGVGVPSGRPVATSSVRNPRFPSSALHCNEMVDDFSLETSVVLMLWLMEGAFRIEQVKRILVIIHRDTMPHELALGDGGEQNGKTCL